MGDTDKHYWESRWQLHQTGWDLGMVSPPLKNFIDTLTDKNLRILIPGCGNAYEARYLLEKGFTAVTVIDIAPSLIETLLHSFGDTPFSNNLQTVCGNFFDLTAEYDLILEQTFFCAINPELRNQYALKCNELLPTGGKVVGVLFNRMFDGGPPFGGSAQEYERYFKPFFRSIKMEPCLTSAQPRLGSEIWIELVK